MIQFEYSKILYFLLLIPVLVLFYFWNERQQTKRLNRFVDKDLSNIIVPDRSLVRQRWKMILFNLALASFIIGFANPQIGSKLEEVKRKGVEMMIALDVSNSMLAEDIKPNRLERAKRTISQLIDKLHGDKVGLIVFAGKAYVQMPTTTDYSAAKMFLNSISPGIIPVQGTVIQEAIELSINSFTDDNDKNKVLVLITDGENHEEGALEAAETALQKGIHIYTIGMGLPKGTPIPVFDRLGRKDYRRDKNGEVVITKLNETFLQQLAAKADGDYIPATRLDDLLDDLQKMDQQEFESKVYADYEDRFQYFFGLALLFLVLDQILLGRKNKFFKKINWLDIMDASHVKPKQTNK
ncbi:MAG: VWA domain-containing protein [Bacteroidales bacterium]|nr:VWA domain-containing protein [Bacteroidales bacterium]